MSLASLISKNNLNLFIAYTNDEYSNEIEKKKQR